VLSNLETNDQKLLQIVIVGQLNLLEILQKAELRQLDQRISIRCSLKALTREEVEAYVTHRLWVARGSTSVIFTAKAFDLVHAISGGVPRMINLLCDRALMVGCDKQTSLISEDHVVAAAAQLGQDIPKGKIKGERAAKSTAPATSVRPAAPGSKRTIGVAAAVLSAALVGAIIFFYGNPLELLKAGPPPAAPRPPARVAPVKLAAAPPADLPAAPAIPPPLPASAAIVIGTYDNVKDVERAEASLRALKLTPYEIDILMGPGDVQRRVLIGRYTTREEVDAVLAKLGPAFPNARAIPSVRERARILAP